MNVCTTFRELRDAGACQNRYRFLAKALGGVNVYGQDTPICILTILEKNGIDDAEWALYGCPSLESVCREYWVRLKSLYREYRAKLAPIYSEALPEFKPLTDCNRDKRAGILKSIVEEVTP